MAMLWAIFTLPVIVQHTTLSRYSNIDTYDRQLYHLPAAGFDQTLPALCSSARRSLFLNPIRIRACLWNEITSRMLQDRNLRPCSKLPYAAMTAGRYPRALTPQ
jgi:hypothetical protein